MVFYASVNMQNYYAFVQGFFSAVAHKRNAPQGHAINRMVATCFLPEWILRVSMQANKASVRADLTYGNRS